MGSIGSLALKSKSFQFSDRRLKFVSSNPIPKNLIKMSEEVKTDAAPAEAPSAEDLKGQKRTLEAEVADGEIKKQKTENGDANGAADTENGAGEHAEEVDEEEEEGDEEEDLDEEDEELDGEEGEEDLDEEAEGEEGEEEEDGEGDEEEDEEDA